MKFAGSNLILRILQSFDSFPFQLKLQNVFLVRFEMVFFKLNENVKTAKENLFENLTTFAFQIIEFLLQGT